MYKVPNVSESKIDDLADVFLVGTSVDDLDAAGKAQARNVTRSIFVVQQGDESVSVTFEDNAQVKPDVDGGAVAAVCFPPPLLSYHSLPSLLQSL